MTPVFITSFNLLSPLKAMVERIRTCPDLEPVIVDNASEYPPLVDWLKRCPCTVILLPENVGSQAAWSNAACREQMRRGPYIVTDCDLDLSPCDLPQFHRTARELLERDQRLRKVGFALEVADLPATSLSEQIRRWERRFWTERYPCKVECYRAPIDTTWAMYRKGDRWPGYGPSVRVTRAARHLPWYPEHHQTDEWRYMLSKVDPQKTHWSAVLKEAVA
jgi:hypothetical protein